METIWREKDIGKVLGGYLENATISIYNTNYVVVRNSKNIIEFINKDTVIDCKVIDSSTKSNLGKAIVGDVLLNVAASTAMSREQHYSLEITWANNEKSFIGIVGVTYYQFFMSKLYESGSSILLDKIKQDKINRLAKDKESIKEKIFKLEEEYDFNRIDFDYFGVNNNYKSNLKCFLDVLPYYKAEYKNDIDEIVKCENNIEKYNKIINQNCVSRDIAKKYNKTSSKVIDCFIFDQNKSFDDNNMSDIEKINEIRECLPIDDLYSDEELLLMLPRSEKENVDYFIKKFIDNELYDYLYNLHIEYGYIYVDKNIEIQKNTIRSYKDKIPVKLYTLLNRIVDRELIYDSNLITSDDFISIDTYGIVDKLIAPSHFLISYFLNCYFGKQEVKEKTVSNRSVSNSNKYDDIKKIKDLYDMGAITKEEFESEKKKLLDS